MGHGFLVTVLAHGVYVDVWKLAKRLHYKVPPALNQRTEGFGDYYTRELPDLQQIETALEEWVVNIHIDHQDKRGFKETYGTAFITCMGKELEIKPQFPKKEEVDLGSLTLDEAQKKRLKEVLGDLYETPLLRHFSYEPRSQLKAL